MGDLLTPVYAVEMDDISALTQAVSDRNELIAALKQCQRVLAQMVDPNAIKSSSVLNAWAQAVAAETVAHDALAKAGAL